MMFQNRRSAASREAGVATNVAEKLDRPVIKETIMGERNECAGGRAESARRNPGKV